MRVDESDESSQQMKFRDLYVEEARRRALFLQAWKEATALAGAKYFGDGSEDGPDIASNKNDLRPNLERIRKVLRSCSPAEGLFLAELYSFYNDFVARELLKDFVAIDLGTLASELDLKRRQVLAQLFVNYSGW